jgi:hypothetical protein
MKTPSAECREVRDRLLDLALAPPGREDLPRAMEAHLRICPGCRKYREGISAASRPVSPEPLFTPALRRRALAAAERELDRPSWLAPLLVPASLAGLATSIVAPVWLFTALLRPLVGSEWASLGLSLALSSSAGLAAAALGLVVLNRRRQAGTLPATSGRHIREVFRG